MSLFGTSPDDDDRPSRTRQSALFDDEPSARPTAKQSNSSLFADDDLNGSSSSPWEFPTPKRAARGTLVKSLLPSSDVPESYIDAYDALLASSSGERSVGGGIGIMEVRGLLNGSGLPEETQTKIWEIVVHDRRQVENTGFGRNEFNVLLALIGLAQEGDDVNLDGVDERRKNLPEPDLPIPKLQKLPKQPEDTRTSSSHSQSSHTPHFQPNMSPDHSRVVRKQSFGFGESDPWASPELHRGHSHMSAPAVPTTAAAVAAAPAIDPASSINGIIPERTTSAFTTSSNPIDSNHIGNNTSSHRSVSGESSGWGSYNGASGGGFTNPGLEGGAFGGPPESGEEGNGGSGAGGAGIGRSLGGGRIVANNGSEEVITVTTIPEKEGMFLFQHRNYQVTSARRNSKVIRRYSDFVWLLDCLHKRYPFRQLSLLPPKRVATTDASFVEKRRKGLARFANALVRHPVLSQEQLVVMFLTVPTELAVWRKQATISVQEEFTGKPLPPTLEDSLPPNLIDLFEQVRSGVRRSAEVYINLCNLVERLTKRNEGIAADYARFSLALRALTEVSNDTYAVDTNDVALLNEGLNSTAKHLSTSQALLEDESRAWDEGVLEDFKRQRDSLVSMRDLFDRKDRLARDNIPQLEKRIQANEEKLAIIRSKPENLQKPGEAEKVEEAIVRDKQSIVTQHARGVFIKECIRDELIFFQSSQYHVSRLHQEWSQERVKYAELQADNWRALSEEVDGMPLGD